MKILLIIISLCFSFGQQADLSYANFDLDEYKKSFYKDRTPWSGPDSIDLWKEFKDQAEASGMREKFLKFLGIDPASLAEWGVWFVKSWINIILSFAWLIALCFMIYGFVRVFFAAGEEALTNAWTIVRISSIALAIIATSWFIESLMFYIYSVISSPL